MKNILTIFKRDVRGLFTHAFALVVAIGLCLLPALYAWFNIYSNWDPYGSTGNIQVAVANLDQGWNKDGKDIHMGADIVESLRQKDSIGWVFLDTEEEAVSGIESGAYYAAIVIAPEFSYGMYNGILQDDGTPRITYYVNGKKNAVATKITDTAVGSVTTSINEQYIKAIATQIFTETNGLTVNLEDGEIMDQVLGGLKDIEEHLKVYESMIQSFEEANSAMKRVMDGFAESMLDSSDALENGAGDLADTNDEIAESQASFATFSDTLISSLKTIDAALGEISSLMDAAKLEDDAEKLQADLVKIKKDAGSLLATYEGLGNVIDKIYKDNELNTPDWLVSGIATAKVAAELTRSIEIGADAGALTELGVDAVRGEVESAQDSVKELRQTLENQMIPNVNAVIDSIESNLASAETTMRALSSATEHTAAIFTEVGGAFDSVNSGMDQVLGYLEEYYVRLREVTDMMELLSGEEQMELLMSFLSADPQTLGEFFSEPVQVENHYIYEIANYGSGVAPFYTTLAIWVGMTVLVSVVKVHAGTKDLKNVKPHEAFFGRYLIFFLMSQVQVAIIVLGDLFLLKIQCVSPFYFWLAASMTGFTFSLIVYALTISFGDIGKALAVVIMVLQIAGSGGTYPIEALPEFFRKVYIFFPFPYAIDAMRECVGGMYESKYMTCMLQLGLFCITALMVGLWVRLPFIKVNHFIEKRMEDTEIL